MRTRSAGLLSLLVTSAAASLVACDDGSEGAARTTTTAADSVPSGGSIRLTIDDGADRTTDGIVDLTIDGADDADEVQVDVDPTFSAAEWAPMTGSFEYELRDGGYQMVFARVRTSSTGEISPVVVAGIDVDLTWDAATASEDGNPHRVSWAGLVAPDVLQVRVETGRVIWNGDAPGDLHLGTDLDISALDDLEGFELAGSSIIGVSRVSRPFGDSMADELPPLVHDFYLTLSDPLTTSAAHQLSFPGSDIESLRFNIEPSSTPSPAVHVNQVGFAPDDGGKFAFVSAWTGDGGGVEYPDAMPFVVINEESGAVALTGTTARRTDDVRSEWTRGDLTGAEVHEADFSSIATPGRYRVCLPSLGCSASFAISDTSTWRRASVAVARSLYHQRSGQALGQPYTSIERPRSFHPDDGTAFLQSTLTMLDNPNLIGIDDRFGEYPNSSTGETVSGAWGGHYDAGDWNSRIQHLEYLRVALDLVRLYPDTYANLELQIPESGDSIPDVVDEGLWSLDQFMRLQQGDGGIPGNIDQARFGEGEEASWDNDLDVFVFAPDMWSTYIYAGVAAKTALVLQDYDQERAEAYAQSATLAMDWAESQWSQQGELDELIVEAVSWERAGAATSMLALDGDDSWNDVVAEATPLDEGPLDVLLCHDLGTCAAVWEYSQLDPSLARQPMLQNSVESLRRNADAVLAAQETAGYAWVMELDGLNLVWGLGPSTPHGYGLLRAFVVTGDEKYRTAMVRGASFSLGGNPLNVSFATGLGSQTPRYPLIVDALHRGLPVWPGTFEFGIHDLHIIEDDSWIENDLLRPARTYPDPLDVPVLWSWYDVSPVAAMNEFTVSQSHAPAMWALGVLAATNN